MAEAKSTIDGVGGVDGNGKLVEPGKNQEMATGKEAAVQGTMGSAEGNYSGGELSNLDSDWFQRGSSTWIGSGFDKVIEKWCTETQVMIAAMRENKNNEEVEQRTNIERHTNPNGRYSARGNRVIIWAFQERHWLDNLWRDNRHKLRMPRLCGLNDRIPFRLPELNESVILMDFCSPTRAIVVSCREQFSKATICKINKHGPIAPVCISAPPVNSFVLYRYRNLYRRCRVLSIQNSADVRLYLVDLGLVRTTKFRSLRSMPRSLISIQQHSVMLRISKVENFFKKFSWTVHLPNIQKFHFCISDFGNKSGAAASPPCYRLTELPKKNRN